MSASTGSSSNGLPSSTVAKVSTPVTARRPVIHSLQPQGGTSSAPVLGPSKAVSGSEASEGTQVKPNGGGPSAVKRPVLNSILVNTCQRGNPVLALLQSTPWEYSDIGPDYQVGATSGILFLSLRYHRLHPEYIHNRINKLGRAYQLRILLVLCDVDDHDASIRELTKTGIINDYTVMVAWSNAEVARYLTLYKSFERKPPDLIKERIEQDYLSRVTNALTSSVRGVNKTDVITLCTNFGSVKRMAAATSDELLSCPGLGEKKVKRLREAFSAPFTLNHRVSAAEKRGREGNSLN